jgi:hypothetical protein
LFKVSAGGSGSHVKCKGVACMYFHSEI